MIKVYPIYEWYEPQLRVIPNGYYYNIYPMVTTVQLHLKRILLFCLVQFYFIQFYYIFFDYLFYLCIQIIVYLIF